jgi:hypothetical protein
LIVMHTVMEQMGVVQWCLLSVQRIKEQPLWFKVKSEWGPHLSNIFR